MRCPSDAELAAGGTRVEAHVASCPRCAELAARDRQVVAIGATLPWRDASAARVEELRAELLAAAGTAEQPPIRAYRRHLAIGLAVAAAVAVAVVGLRAPSDDPVVTVHGTISAHSGATWLRVSLRPDEIVRLVNGAITVDVTPLGAGERFRVVTGDGEVEVRGTSFEVVADRDHLTAVHVWSGHVRVTPATGSAVLLAPGGSWAPAAPITASTIPVGKPASVEIPPPPAVAVAPRPQTPRPQPHAPPGVPPRVPPRMPNESEASYNAAWQALRAADYATAATGFAHTAELSSPLAEDASFWRGVALARAKRAIPARTAFEAFLERFPHSPRAGEASAMLGWLLVDAGELTDAEARFRAAIDDPVDSVRASARHGLATVSRLQ